MLKQPVRVIEGSAKPFERFWTLRDAADTDSGEPEIEFYGYISEFSLWGDEVTPALFKEDLNTLGKGGPVTVRINSGGGEVFAASVIRSMIVDYPGRVTTRIDGLCASAATYIAMAGDRVLMQDSAFFMIHDPAMIAWGTIDTIKAALDELKVIKSGIIDSYRSKTHLDGEKLSKMMSAETWMTAQQALEFGFVDEVISLADKGKSRTQNRAFLNCLTDYANVPEEVLAALQETPAGDELADVNVAEEPEPEGESESEAEVEPEDVQADVQAENLLEKAAQELRKYLDVFGPRKE